MPRYRHALPQLQNGFFLTDGGLETTLIYHYGIDLPEFAAFVALGDEAGRDKLRTYYRCYLDIAREHDTGFVLESVTWRASRDWGQKIGYSPQQIADFNRLSIALLEDLRGEYEEKVPHVVMSGCLGPRGDGYRPQRCMTEREAEDYHRTQIATFRETEADMVAALTIPYAEEAIGIARAARAEAMPAAISFTVETDGNLPSGESLEDAILRTDAATAEAPAYYMVNCAHPTHFIQVLNGGTWAQRIRGIRANASTRSHAELNEMTELDAGDPQDLGARYRDLADQLRNLTVLGGCCGTDHRHVAEISRSVVRKEGAQS